MRVLTLFILLFVAAISYSRDVVAFNFNNPLVNAADSGDHDKLIRLIQNGYKPDSRGEFGVTPLMRAALRGHVDIAKTLLESGAYVDAFDIGGDTALHLAAKSGNIEIVKLLLKYDAYINSNDKEKWTPLMRAASAKQADVVALLLENGANILAKNNIGESVLVQAATIHKPEILELILNNNDSHLYTKKQHNLARATAEKRGNTIVGRILSQFRPYKSGSFQTAQTPQQYNQEPQPYQSTPSDNYKNEKLAIKRKLQGYSEAFPEDFEQKPNNLPHTSQQTYKNLPQPAERPKNATYSDQKGAITNDEFYTMQFGVYSNTNNAQQKWFELKRNHGDILNQISSEIIPNINAYPTSYSLRAGRYKWKDIAHSNCSTFRARNIDCIIKKASNKQYQMALASLNSSSEPTAQNYTTNAHVNTQSQAYSPPTPTSSHNYMNAYNNNMSTAIYDSSPTQTPRNYNYAQGSNNTPYMHIQHSNQGTPTQNNYMQQHTPINSNNSMPWLEQQNTYSNVNSAPFMQKSTNNMYNMAQPQANQTMDNNWSQNQVRNSTPIDIMTPKQNVNNAVQYGSHQSIAATKQSPYNNISTNPYIEDATAIKRTEFFKNQYRPEPKVQRDYGDFYKQMQSMPSKQKNVSEAILMPENSSFGSSSYIQNEQPNNWLEVGSFRDKFSANDYGNRMFRFDEDLQNLNILIIDHVTPYGMGTALRVGPVTYSKANDLCASVRSGGLGCDIKGKNPIEAYVADTRPHPKPKPPKPKSYWINLGTFADTPEAEYYWSFLQEDNNDLIGYIKHDMASAAHDSFGENAVQLRAGPFDVKGRADQLCNIMRYRNIACLVQ